MHIEVVENKIVVYMPGVQVWLRIVYYDYNQFIAAATSENPLWVLYNMRVIYGD